MKASNTHYGVLTVLALLVVVAVGISVMHASDNGAADPGNTNPKFGAIPGNDIAPNGYYSIGAVNYYANRQAISATSSMLCITKNPFATSTLVSYDVSVKNNAMGATATFDLSTTSAASNGYASSTAPYLKAASLPTGPSNIVMAMASTTNTAPLGADATGSSYNVIGPGLYVTARVATGTPSAMASYVTGNCDYTFRELK